MTLEDIQNAFQHKIVKRGVADHPNKRIIPSEAIVLETFSDGGEIWVDTTTFLFLFGTQELTHASLSASPLAKTSWGKYFDDWKAQSIIA